MPDVVAHTDTGQKLEIYAEVRHACAVNSAAMVPFIGAESFSQRVSTCLRALAADPYFVVRRAVAANALELCRQLHPFSSVMHSLLIQLLIDPCSDVTFALVPQIGAVLEHLARLSSLPHGGGPFITESIVSETCEAVLRCEEQVMNGSSWRIQADMLSQLAAFPLCLPCHPVHDLLIPRLWHRIETVVRFLFFFFSLVICHLTIFFLASASLSSLCRPNADAVRPQRAPSPGEGSSVQ